MSKFCFTHAVLGAGGVGRCRCHLGSGGGGGGSYDPGAWRGPSLTEAKAGVQEVKGCQGHLARNRQTGLVLGSFVPKFVLL